MTYFREAYLLKARTDLYKIWIQASGNGSESADADHLFVTNLDYYDEESVTGYRKRNHEIIGKKNASTSKISTKANSEMDNANTTDKTDDENSDEEKEVDYEHLRPTFSHEAIRKMIEDDRVKYLISQNCDGLHILSGIDATKISELHGNVFKERCEKCGSIYWKPYYVCDDISDLYLEEVADFGQSDIIVPKFMKKCELCGLSHRTGRFCEAESCGGYLCDTIINFCDDLEADVLNKAFKSAKQCDLLVCLGTTLAVTPACNIVHHIKTPRRIVICNRQVTEKDKESLKLDRDGAPLGARIHGDCDVFMKFVMEYLLGEDDYKSFVSSISERQKQYDEQRSKPSVI